MDEHSKEWLYEELRKQRVRINNLENIQGYLAKTQEIQEEKIGVLMLKTR